MLKKLLAAASVAVVLQVGGAAAIAQTAAARPPIEAYGALGAIDDIALSPDGTKIAFTAQVGDKRAFVVRSLAGENLGATDLAGQMVMAVTWADDTHVIITTTKKINATSADRQQIATAQIYNTDTRKFYAVMGTSSGASRAGSLNRTTSGASMIRDIAGPPSVRYANGKTVVEVGSLTATGEYGAYNIDIETGHGTLLPPPYFGVRDESGAIVARSQGDWEKGTWWLEAKDGVGFRKVYEMKADKVDWPSLIGIGRSPGTALISVPEADEDVIYEVNLTTGARVPLVFEGAGSGAVSPYYQYRTGKLLGFSYLVGNTFQYVFIDPTVAKIWAAVEKGLPGKLVTPVSWTPDFKKLVLYTQGPGDSGTYLLMDVAANRASKIGSYYPTIQGDAVNEVRWITYKAADGLEIPAYLTLPRGRDPKGLPLIVMPHGGPQARDTPGFDFWSQAFASRGYAVLQPQFRGSEGFGIPHIRAGHGQWGKKMQTDLSDGVRYLAGQGIVDPKRVCINGWSYGGYAAMAGVTFDPGVYRCAIAGAGVFDLPRMMLWANGESRSADTFVARYWKRNMGGNRVGDPALAQVSPSEFADRVNVPVLLIHGKQDTVVPYAQSELMAKALKAAGKPYEFVTLENEDHHLQRADERLKMLKASIAFLEKHNPPT